MIPWFGAIFLVLGFVILAHLFRLVDKTGEVVTVAQRSLGVIRSTELSDDSKEEALQEDAKQLFRLSLVLASGGAGAVLMPVGILWLSDRIGLLSLDSVLSVALSPLFLVLSGVFGTLVFFVSRRQGPDKAGYSVPDQMLHQVAFKTKGAQISVADIEDRLFSKQLAKYKVEQPVFITALPRAGTTLLLECFAQLPEFASHCYRDMPFVLIPCLWAQYSTMFQQEGTLRERAHGDGMMIDFDSPEALEEVLWKTFWSRHYKGQSISVWQSENNEEFSDFFGSHIRKIMFLRDSQGTGKIRYLSKNNLNIARIPLLHRLFPDSIIVVPFRDPIHHAASLLEQHLKFSAIHQEDSFARQYMEAIGHYDFGLNLRPVNFDNWLEASSASDPESLAFWLEYWVATYRHLLKDVDGVVLISYENLCDDPKGSLFRLADIVGIRQGDELAAIASTIHSPRKREVDVGSVDSCLVAEAQEIFRNLLNASQR